MRWPTGCSRDHGQSGRDALGRSGRSWTRKKWAESSNRPPRRPFGCWQAIWARPSHRIVLPSPAFCHVAANAFRAYCRRWPSARVHHSQAGIDRVHARRLCCQGNPAGRGCRGYSPGVVDRKNILVAGGTGSGKTTLVNAILAEPAVQERSHRPHWRTRKSFNALRTTRLNC